MIFNRVTSNDTRSIKIPKLNLLILLLSLLLSRILDEKIRDKNITRAAEKTLRSAC